MDLDRALMSVWRFIFLSDKADSAVSFDWRDPMFTLVGDLTVRV